MLLYQRLNMIIKYLNLQIQMSDLLLGLIPDELILSILHYTNCDEFFTLLSLFPLLNDKSLPIGRKIVSHQTGLRTNSFDLDKLKKISKFRYARNIFAGKLGIIMNKYLHTICDDTKEFVISLENIIQAGDLDIEEEEESELLLCISNNKLYSYFSGKNPHKHELDDVISLSTNSHHGLILKSNGEVYGIGLGDYELGIISDSELKITSPQLIPNLKNIIQVAAGFCHSLALSSDGRVYVFGDNDLGQLGLEFSTSNYKYLPTELSLNNIVQITAGQNHSLVLNIEGHVYGFGYNKYGQLGLGIYRDKFCNPVFIKKNIISISSYNNHSLLLNAKGNVYAFGCNSDHQLGLNDNIDRFVPTIVPGLTNIIQISAGDDYSLALDKSGYVYIFGLMHLTPEHIYYIGDTY